MRPVCLYGGTFDPPHIAHLIHAQLLIDYLHLQKLYFVISANPPHKQDQVVTALEHRLEMLKRAIRYNEYFAISTYEIEKGGLSYSIETIRYYRRRYNLQKEELYFVIGMDSLRDFPTWREPSAILNESTVLVLPRPGVKPEEIEQTYLRKSCLLDFPVIDISASFIRSRVAQGLPITYLVPREVEQYILENRLYRSERELSK